MHQQTPRPTEHSTLDLAALNAGDKVFSHRGLNLYRVVLTALVELSHQAVLTLSPETVTAHLSLQATMDLRHDRRLSVPVRVRLFSYLASTLSGYDDLKRDADHQHEQVQREHGFIQAAVVHDTTYA